MILGQFALWKHCLHLDLVFKVFPNSSMLKDEKLLKATQKYHKVYVYQSLSLIISVIPAVNWECHWKQAIQVNSNIKEIKIQEFYWSKCPQKTPRMISNLGTITTISQQREKIISFFRYLAWRHDQPDAPLTGWCCSTKKKNGKKIFGLSISTGQSNKYNSLAFASFSYRSNIRLRREWILCQAQLIGPGSEFSISRTSTRKSFQYPGHPVVDYGHQHQLVGWIFP